MERVAHNGRETAYRVVRPDGAGSTLLYVHGSGGSHRVWAQQYAPSGPSHPAVALDLSGHGASEDVDTQPGDETLTAYVEDVCAVARATAADVLVGNSLGGAVVFETLLGRSLDVQGAVFAGTGATLAVGESLRSLLAEDFPTAVDVLHGEDLLFHDVDAATVDRSKAQLHECGQQTTRRDFLTCHRFDVRDSLAEITLPVLAVVGEYDGLTPPESHESLAAALPDCALSVLDDCAHLAMLERPAAFNDAIAKFVGEI